MTIPLFSVEGGKEEELSVFYSSQEGREVREGTRTESGPGGCWIQPNNALERSLKAWIPDWIGGIVS
jgi:hypothetical protein